MKRLLVSVLLGGALACGGALRPAALDTGHDTCASCRMVVSDRHVASQVIAAGEEPRFFDDLGCLGDYLAHHPQADARIFVADHRTGDWVAADAAVFSRLARRATPMASGIVAHADAASRAADSVTADSQRVSFADALGATASRIDR